MASFSFSVRRCFVACCLVALLTLGTSAVSRTLAAPAVAEKPVRSTTVVTAVDNSEVVAQREVEKFHKELASLSKPVIPVSLSLPAADCPCKAGKATLAEDAVVQIKTEVSTGKCRSKCASRKIHKSAVARNLTRDIAETFATFSPAEPTPAVETVSPVPVADTAAETPATAAVQAPAVAEKPVRREAIEVAVAPVEFAGPAIAEKAPRSASFNGPAVAEAAPHRINPVVATVETVEVATKPQVAEIEEAPVVEDIPAVNADVPAVKNISRLRVLAEVTAPMVMPRLWLIVRLLSHNS